MRIVQYFPQTTAREGSSVVTSKAFQSKEVVQDEGRSLPIHLTDRHPCAPLCRLCLMQEKREIGRDCLRKVGKTEPQLPLSCIKYSYSLHWNFTGGAPSLQAVELSKAAYGARNHVLVPLLKELASVRSYSAV